MLILERERERKTASWVKEDKEKKIEKKMWQKDRLWIIVNTLKYIIIKIYKFYIKKFISKSLF